MNITEVDITMWCTYTTTGVKTGNEEKVVWDTSSHAVKAEQVVKIVIKHTVYI